MSHVTSHVWSIPGADWWISRTAIPPTLRCNSGTQGRVGRTSIPFRTLNANSPYGLDPPSTLALPSEFQYYNDAKRIFNDRPKTDIRVTPIALLYVPFVQFLDHIRDPPETLDDLDLRELEFSVNNFASVMCEYHRDENTRQEKVLPALNKI